MTSFRLLQEGATNCSLVNPLTTFI